MDRIAGLHTIARRHCIERHGHWIEVYRLLDASDRVRKHVDDVKWGYTAEAYATFPRYLVWRAILDEIERLDPRRMLDTRTLRDELRAAGRRAGTDLTANPALPVTAHTAMDEERKEFEDFVMSVPDDQLEAIEPLPLRRVFGKEELHEHWGILAARWDAKPGYRWWPLREGTAPPEVIAFHMDWFDAAKVSVLREILTGHGVGLVWELREFGEWGCERCVSEFEPVYTGEEGYWISSGSDWLVHASHESSITLAGGWLLESFSQHFPESTRCSYRGPMSTADRRGSWSF